MDATEATKKYWPFALGAIAVVYLLTRGGGGGADTSTSAYYAMIQAQQAAGAQNAQLSAQRDAAAAAAAAQNAQIKLQYDTLQAQRDIAMVNAQVLKEKAEGENAASFLMAQAQLAAGAGSAATGIISALNQPSIAAIGAMSNENQAALMSSALIAAAGFKAQSGLMQAALNIVPNIGAGLTRSPWGGNSAIQSQNAAGAASVQGAAQGTAQSAGAISQANASGTSSTIGGFTSIMGMFF